MTTTYADLASNVRGNLTRLRAQRDEQTQIIRAVQAACDRDGQRNPADAEAVQVRAAVARRAELDEQITDLDLQAGEYERQSSMSGTIAQRAREEDGGGRSWSPGRSSGVDPYRQDGDHSYFLDLNAARTGDAAARERLDVHRQVVADRLRDSNEPMLRAMFRAADDQTRAVSSGSGSVGPFLPPIWLIDEYVQIFRPARATLDALHAEPLPPVGMTVNVPKLSTGTVVAAQTAENTVVATQDLAAPNSIIAPVNTLAGHLPLSWQVRDRSGFLGGFDLIVQQDLLAAYIQASGGYVISGSGASNQPLGLLNLAGITSIAYTDATPAFMGAGKLYSKIAQAIQSVQTSRYLSPNAIIMHPRRWAWLSVQTDSAGRAVVLPADGNPQNASGIASTGAAQGLVGRMLGCDVIADPNVPINLGAGTNEDRIIVARTDDSWFFEDGPYIDSYDQTLATQLSREMVLYSYVALVHRSPGSIAVINGTGLATPTF